MQQEKEIGDPPVTTNDKNFIATSTDQECTSDKIESQHEHNNNMIREPPKITNASYFHYPVKSIYDFKKVPGIKTKSDGQNVYIVDSSDPEWWTIFDPITKEYINVPEHFLVLINEPKQEEDVENLRFFIPKETEHIAFDLLLNCDVLWSFFIIKSDDFSSPYMLIVLKDYYNFLFMPINYDNRLGYYIDRGINFPTIRMLIGFYKVSDNQYRPFLSDEITKSLIRDYEQPKVRRQTICDLFRRKKSNQPKSESNYYQVEN